MTRTELTLSQRKRITELCASGANIQDICTELGISRTTSQQIDQLQPESGVDAPVHPSSEGMSARSFQSGILLSQRDPLALIGIPSMHGMTYVHVSDIVYCQGESSQTSMYLLDKQRHIVNRTLKKCEELLGRFGFCRIHKSYLINLQHLRKFHRGENRRVEMSDGSKLDVTRRYQDEFLSRLLRL